MHHTLTLRRPGPNRLFNNADLDTVLKELTRRKTEKGRVFRTFVGGFTLITTSKDVALAIGSTFSLEGLKSLCVLLEAEFHRKNVDDGILLVFDEGPHSSVYVTRQVQEGDVKIYFHIAPVR